MKYVTITLQFFQKYWPEVQRCAGLTVELWTELMKLAPKLAQELRRSGPAEWPVEAKRPEASREEPDAGITS